MPLISKTDAIALDQLIDDATAAYNESVAAEKQHWDAAEKLYNFYRNLPGGFSSLSHQGEECTETTVKRALGGDTHCLEKLCRVLAHRAIAWREEASRRRAESQEALDVLAAVEGAYNAAKAARIAAAEAALAAAKKAAE